MNPQNVYQAYMKAGLEWADRTGAAELLESTLKILKAQYTLEAKRAESCSMAEAETIAITMTEYREATVKAVEARTEANRAKVRYTSVQAMWEATRTQEATERAAMRAAP